MACRFVLCVLTCLFFLSCSQEPPVSSPSSAFAEESGPWQTVSINGATYRRVAAKPTETSQADLLITIPISYETGADGSIRFSDTVQIAGRTYTADCTSTGGGQLDVVSDDVGDTQATATSISVLNPPTGSTEFEFTDSDEFTLTENDVDYFRLLVSKTVELSVATRSNIDTRGTLYNSSGITLNCNDDGFTERDPDNRNFFLWGGARGTRHVLRESGRIPRPSYRLV